MRQAMAPALREILTAEELAATTITAVREPPEARDPEHHVIPPFDQWPQVEDEALLDDQILLRVCTFSDSIGIWAGGGRETAEELHERFRSDLQDFVAESTFGWGQLRP